jgi:hypothetical protein
VALMVRKAVYLISVIGCTASFAFEANAASCRWFAREAQAAIGAHVASMQRIEHEASDRLKGLDSRPFEFLAGEARKLSTIIADPAALKDEEGPRCRNKTVPIRKICADASRLLVEILDKYVAGPRPDYDKPQYAAAVAACEKQMALKPLASAIRGTE